DRLAVVADLEVQHVAVGAGAPHLRDLLAGLHRLALADQALAVVAVGRQPVLVVLDDDQLAVADQAGAGIHHHAVGRGDHRLAAAAADVDALAGVVAGDEGPKQHALRGPAPGEAAAGRHARGGRRRRGRAGGRAGGRAAGRAARGWLGGAGAGGRPGRGTARGRAGGGGTGGRAQAQALARI